MFFPKAGSLWLVYSRRESYLLNTNKARAHLYVGAPDSFQTENSYIVGIETGISRTEVRVLTIELRRRPWDNFYVKHEFHEITALEFVENSKRLHVSYKPYCFIKDIK